MDTSKSFPLQYEDLVKQVGTLRRQRHRSNKGQQKLQDVASVPGAEGTKGKAGVTGT